MEFLIPIILMLLSFFLQKKNGASNGKAALTAAAVGAVSYGGIKAWQHYKGKGTDAALAASGNEPSAVNDTVPASVGVGQTVSNITGQAADVLKSWGPGGTLAVGGGLAFGDRIINFVREHPLLVGGIAALFIWKMTDK